MFKSRSNIIEYPSHEFIKSYLTVEVKIITPCDVVLNVRTGNKTIIFKMW